MGVWPKPLEDVTPFRCRPQKTLASCWPGPCPSAQQTPGFSMDQVGSSRQTCHAAFGDVFSVIGVREPQPAASEAFVKFADAHRSIEKFGIRLLKTIKPVGLSTACPTSQGRNGSLAQEGFWAESGARCRHQLCHLCGHLSISHCCPGSLLNSRLV